MSEQFKQDNSSVPPQADQDVMALLIKIQERLVFLERKIDTLINKPQERSFKSQERPFKPQERSFNRERNYSKPSPRPYGHSPSYGQGQRDHSSREKSYGQGRPYEKRSSDENRGFSHKKKPFFQKRKERG